MKKVLQLILISLILTSCLRTRSDISEQDQNYAYGKKNADNQTQAQTATAASQDSVVQNTVIDEKDELIRNLNGRVETLENQLAEMNKQKEEASAQEGQKMTLLQEALTKMEAQIAKLEAGQSALIATEGSKDNSLKSSDETSEADKGVKKLNAYDAAQQYFVKQEWKKAILNFQKYTDESPKGKNVADSKYKIGVCFQELGMKEEAMAFYEEVVANYSKTEAGKKSKARLAKLKK